MAKSITSFNASEQVSEIINEVKKNKETSVSEFVNNAILESVKPKITHEVPKITNVRVKA